MQIKVQKLKNGLTVLQIPQKNWPVFSLVVLVKAGGAFVDPTKKGLAHTVEHLFFKGTKTRPTTADILGSADKMGTEINAFTGKETMGFYLKARPVHFTKGLDLLADLVLNPLFREEDLAVEKKAIIEEQHMYHDNPMSWVVELFYQGLFGKSPLGFSLFGTEKEILSFKSQDLVSFHQKFFTCENAVVVLMGNFPQKLEEVQKAFSRLKKGKPKFSKEFLETGKKELIIEPRKTQQTHIVVGTLGAKLGEVKKRAIQKILNTILAGGYSLLFREIREKRGWAYYVVGEAEQFLEAGTFLIRVGIAPDKTEEALKIILDRFAKLQKEIDEVEIKRAKEFLKGKLALSMENSTTASIFFGEEQLLRGEVLVPEKIFDLIDKIKKEEIIEEAKELFNQRIYCAIIGKGKFGKIKRILKGGI